MSYLSNYHFMNDHPFHFFSYRTSSHTDYVYVQYTHTYTKPEASTHDLDTFSLPQSFQQSMDISSQSLTGFISPGRNSVASLR